MGFYLLPFFSKDVVLRTFEKIKVVDPTNLLIFFFLIINIFFFDFPVGFGGGIFFHLSNKLLGNPILLFFVFIFFIYFFVSNKLINIDNIIIFICLNFLLNLLLNFL